MTDPLDASALAEEMFTVNLTERDVLRFWSYALEKGQIQRHPCACGNPKSHAHHEDFSKPLDVIWLCASCHGKLHHQKRMADLNAY